MQITSCVLPGEHSAEWQLFMQLAANQLLPTKGIHLIPQVVKSASDFYQIPSA